MKGKNLVIGLIIFVIIVVLAVYFSMMAEINKQKEELGITFSPIVLEVENAEYE